MILRALLITNNKWLNGSSISVHGGNGLNDIYIDCNEKYILLCILKKLGRVKWSKYRFITYKLCGCCFMHSCCLFTFKTSWKFKQILGKLVISQPVTIAIKIMAILSSAFLLLALLDLFWLVAVVVGDVIGMPLGLLLGLISVFVITFFWLLLPLSFILTIEALFSKCSFSFSKHVLFSV